MRMIRWPRLVVTALFFFVGTIAFWIATFAWTGALAAIGVVSFWTAWLRSPGVFGYESTRGLLLSAISYLAVGLAWVQVWNGQLRSANGLSAPGYDTPVEVGVVALTWTWHVFEWARGAGQHL